MATHRTAALAVNALQDNVAAQIQSAVKALLESKHLYQSISLDPAKTAKAELSLIPQGAESAAFQRFVSEIDKWPWLVQYPGDVLQQLTSFDRDANKFVWTTPDIKTYCGRCERIEPYNCTARHMLVPAFSGSNILDSGRAVQVFALQYTCQSCKAVPEVFLVRRTGNRLTLSGRTPMESVQVAAVIPKHVASFISDAVVAYQAGQVLAGLFLLRTFCEQWCRPYALPTDRADMALEKYGSTLPDDFKARFPSLKAIYGELSAAIHAASKDSDLFEVAKNRIEEHFEARKIFKLSTPHLVEVA